MWFGHELILSLWALLCYFYPIYRLVFCCIWDKISQGSGFFSDKKRNLLQHSKNIKYMKNMLSTSVVAILKPWKLHICIYNDGLHFFAKLNTNSKGKRKKRPKLIHTLCAQSFTYYRPTVGAILKVHMFYTVSSANICLAITLALNLYTLDLT